MEFKSKKEYEDFIEIATILKYYKYKGVPIPEEIVNEIEANKDSSDVFYVLNDIIKS